MSKGTVLCRHCGKNFLKENRHIHENIKLNHNFYCSLVCQYLFKRQRKELVCENKGCKKKFERTPHEISTHNFCSASCAAVFNNTKRWGSKKQKKLLSKEEKRKIWAKARQKYWSEYWLEHGREYIISKIQNFVNMKGHIPVKRELLGIYKPARMFFGTWNNAVQAAGFDPNPAMFAKKQVAKDGHVCDSLAEKLIDDYLYEKGITHERNFPYPEGEYTADFKVGNQLIEYFGLAGEHQRYDELKMIKQEIARKYCLNVIEIYPRDLYPRNDLEIIFGV